MFKLFDRVKVNIATTGTGTVTFGSASSNAFVTPTEAGAGDGDTVRYLIVDGLDFEVGIGTIGDSVSTMERTTVKESKIGGTAGTSKISLSGTAVLSLTASAADILIPANNLSDLADAATARTNLGGTTVGKALFTATNAAAARAATGVDKLVPKGHLYGLRSPITRQTQLTTLTSRRVKRPMRMATSWCCHPASRSDWTPAGLRGQAMVGWSLAAHSRMVHGMFG